MAFLYNAVVIFMRAAFYSLLHTSRALPLWLASDYFCDTIYIIDIALIRLRLGYLESGIIQVIGMKANEDQYDVIVTFSGRKTLKRFVIVI